MSSLTSDVGEDGGLSASVLVNEVRRLEGKVHPNLDFVDFTKIDEDKNPRGMTDARASR